MKKLSSDTAFYISIGQIIIGPVILMLFIPFVLRPPAAITFAVLVLLIILTIFNFIRLFKKKKLFYTSNSLIIYPNFFSDRSFAIPKKEILNVAEKVSTQRLYGLKTFEIFYVDIFGEHRVLFLALAGTSLYEVKDLLKESEEPDNDNVQQFTAYNFTQNLDVGQRLIAALTDHFIMTAVIAVFALPLMMKEFTSNKFDRSDGVLDYLFDAGFALYFCKDCIYGQSIAKRLFKQQVINHKTGGIAGPLRCFVRDILLLIWPIEFITLLISPTRRLGDRIAGTQVVPFNSERQRTGLNYLQIGIAYLLSVVAVLLLSKLTG